MMKVAKERAVRVARVHIKPCCRLNFQRLTWAYMTPYGGDRRSHPLGTMNLYNKTLIFLNSVSLTCVSHRCEDALGDGHYGVGGLVVAPDGLSFGGVLPHVLQEISQSLTHHARGCAHLQIT